MKSKINVSLFLSFSKQMSKLSVIRKYVSSSCSIDSNKMQTECENIKEISLKRNECIFKNSLLDIVPF